MVNFLEEPIPGARRRFQGSISEFSHFGSAVHESLG